MRLYLPATLDTLAELHSDGVMGVGDDVVVAEGDAEDQEYDALMTAAQTAAELAAELEPGERRRVVVVAELSVASCRPGSPSPTSWRSTPTPTTYPTTEPTPTTTSAGTPPRRSAPFGVRRANGELSGPGLSDSIAAWTPSPIRRTPSTSPT